MSYDVILFEQSKAPRNGREFVEWIDNETDWQEDYDYCNPDVTSKALKSMYDELTKTFPDLNGPEADDDVDEEREAYYAEYDITPNIIYIAFGWSHAEEASELVSELMEKYHVGAYVAGTDKAYFTLEDGSEYVLDLEE